VANPVPDRPVPKPAGRWHHGDLRRALVETALALLEERGVDALTVRELARRLGVSHAAPGHHFPDKLALLAAVAAEGYRRFGASLEAAAQGATAPGERLGRIGMAYVRFALDHPATFRIMFGREMADCADMPEELRAASAAAYAVLERTVAEVAGGPSPLHALAAWSLVHGAALLYLDGPVRHRLPGPDPRDAFEQAMQAILSGAVKLPDSGRAAARPAGTKLRRPGRRANRSGSPRRGR
jgi:AcrR family transcriptional regulator